MTVLKEQLLATVAAAPDEDAPRQILADLLQEEGDPWGALMQLDCRLGALPSFDRGRPPLARARREALRRASGAFWPRFQRAGIMQATIVRGLIEEVRGHYPEAGLGAPALVRTAHLGSVGALQQLSRSPDSARVERLSLIPEHAEAPAVALALGDGSALPALRALRFDVPAGSWSELGILPVVGRMEELVIGLSGDCRPVVRALGRGGVLRLKLESAPDPDALRALLAVTPGLRELNVTFSYRDELRQNIDPITDSRLPALERLTLDFAGELAPRHMAALSALPALRELELRDGTLLEVPSLPPRLERLKLRGMRLDDEAVRMLARVAPESLTALHVAQNPPVEAGLRALLQTPLAGRLVELGLASSRAGTAGARILAAADLPRLRWLDLSGCDLDDAAVAALLSAVPDMRTIAISHAGIAERPGVVVAPKHIVLLPDLRFAAPETPIGPWS